MTTCIFCKIVQGEAPAKKLFQDGVVTAFRDIHPVAATHVLIVPDRHVSSLNEITPDDEWLIGRLFTVARQIAQQEKIDLSGYRIIINTGPQAGQTIDHLHLHLVGGNPMRFPIG